MRIKELQPCRGLQTEVRAHTLWIRLGRLVWLPCPWIRKQKVDWSVSSCNIACPWKELPASCLSSPCRIVGNTPPWGTPPTPQTPGWAGTHWRCHKLWWESSWECWDDPQSCNQNCPKFAWNYRGSPRVLPCRWPGSIWSCPFGANKGLYSNIRCNLLL